MFGMGSPNVLLHGSESFFLYVRPYQQRCHAMTSTASRWRQGADLLLCSACDRPSHRDCAAGRRRRYSRPRRPRMRPGRRHDSAMEEAWPAYARTKASCQWKQMDIEARPQLHGQDNGAMRHRDRSFASRGCGSSRGSARSCDEQRIGGVCGCSCAARLRGGRGSYNQ